MTGNLKRLLSRDANISPARNASFSVLSFALSAVTAFVVSPFIIRALGGSSYGLLSMAGELTAQFALFDLGIRGAVSFFVAQALAREDKEGVERVLRSAIAVLSTLGTVAAAVAVPLVIWLPSWFKLDGITAGPARFTVGILLFAFVVSFPVSIYSALFAGMRRHDLVNAIAIANSVVTTALIVIALLGWGNLTAVAGAQAIGVLLRWPMQAYVYRRVKLGVTFWPPRFEPSTVRSLFTYGGTNLALNLATMVTLQADLVVIGKVAGAAAAGLYQIGRYLGVHMYTLTGAITMTLASNFTHHQTQGDQKSAQELFLSASRAVSSIACLIAGLIFVYGEPFIGLWAGTQYLAGSYWNRGGTILIFITSALLVRAMGNICSQYLLGIRRLRLFTAVRIAEAGVSLGASILLLNWLGTGGVALSKFIVSVGSQMFFGVPYCCRRLEIGLLHYGRVAILRPLLLLGFTALVAFAFKKAIDPTNWFKFFGGGTPAAVLSAAAGLWLVGTPAERERLLGRMRAFGKR
jgi:O-antigen/teichoic acid export membrane protein